MKRAVQVAVGLAVASIGLMAQADAPSRVGRLSYVSGAVSFQPAGVQDWVSAAVNRPLTSGDQLWADSDSRAEIQLGTASLRVGSRTNFQFLSLDDRAVQVRLTEGVLSVHLRELGPGEVFEVDTPNQAFSLLRAGDYRIEADPDQQTTTIIVFEGQGEITGGGQAINVAPQSLVAVRGDQQIEWQVHPAPEMDGWDRWCMERIAREERAQSAHYVPSQMIGYEDLDAYGVWNDSPYGSVWAPRTVPAGWAPYRNGHWAWIEPWGWTWMDDAPWGFAPFHYGRWAYWNSGWVWVPGPRTVRPVYAPAMVVWIGGSGLSGSVGWVPLGPREVYYPGYRYSPGYLERVNRSNTVITNVNITNVYVNNNVVNRRYVNLRAPNGVWMASQRDMAAGRPVQQMARPVHAGQLGGAVVVDRAPVNPERAARLGPGGGGRVMRPPDPVYSRQVVVRNPVAAGAGEQRREWRPMVRQAPAVTQPVIQARPGLQARPSGAVAGQAPQQQQAPQQEPRRGWRTVTPAGQMPADRQMGQPGGWRNPGAGDENIRRQQQDQQRQMDRQQQDMERRERDSQRQMEQRQQRQEQDMERRQQDSQRRMEQDRQRMEQDQQRRERQMQDQQQRQQQEQQRQQQDQQRRMEQDQQRRDQQAEQQRQQEHQRQQQQEQMRRQDEQRRQQQQEHQRQQQQEQMRRQDEQRRQQQQEHQRQQQEQQRQQQEQQRQQREEHQRRQRDNEPKAN